MTLLELEKVRKHFQLKKKSRRGKKECVRAVDDVSLKLQKGENLALVGESGSGKSTLARVIMRLYAADSGYIVFDKENITHAKGRSLRKMRRNMQMVFQDPYSSLDPRFTVRNILKEPMHLDRKRFGSDALKETRCIELMSAVHLTEDMLNRYPHEFSGGERQRIAIARALVLDPQLLLLDEAVSSLDVLIQGEILTLLNELQKKFDLTYLFISHDLQVVKEISHRVAVMYKGKIVELAPVEKIFAKPIHPYTQQLLAAALDYQPAETEDFDLGKNTQLIDQGGGHFVMMGKM